MKKIFVTALISAVFAGGFLCFSTAAVRAEGMVAPNFTLNDIKGNSVSLSDFRNVKPVLVVFWATWCPYCRKEMPKIARLNDRLGDKLEILALSLKESQDKVASYARKEKLHFTMLLDQDGAVASNYGVTGLPTLILIDKEGRRVLVESALSPELQESIDQLCSR